MVKPKLAMQPLKIGKVEISNRIVRTATTTSFSPSGFNDDFIAFHVARARGGVALTILEAGAVHPPSSHLSFAIDDNLVPQMKRLMEQVRPYGMRVFQQLWHGGNSFPAAGGGVPWAVSATPGPMSGIIGTPMGQREIDVVIAAFAAAAVRCKEAGIDGVELHCGHGYLFHQFLSPLYNFRDDHYNGDIHARGRFLYEVVDAVRKAVGPDFPLGVRIGASTTPGGVTAEELAVLAVKLDEEGQVDFLDVSMGDFFFTPAVAHTMGHPSGYEIPTVEKITRGVKMPTMVTGRFRTLEEAEEVLKSGAADMVSMARAHIADPDIVRKTIEDRVEDVRPCIACNQGCIGGLLTIGKMRCAVNPAAGYESTLDETLISRTATPKSVVVVGGGPAGMEAARIAAAAGHRVTLFEASANLGGTLNVAQRAPVLAILGDLSAWLERQIYAAGVDVRLSTYAEKQEILALDPDVVIIATGAAYRADGRQSQMPLNPPTGMNLTHVYDPIRLFTEWKGTPQPANAVVFDDVGLYDAVASAEHLQRLGANVTFVTSRPRFAPMMVGTNREEEALIRLGQGQFRLLVNHNLLGVESDKVSVRAYGAKRTDDIPADIVVVATPREPLRELFSELQPLVDNVVLVGDALSPRDLLAAMHDGHRAARALD